MVEGRDGVLVDTLAKRIAEAVERAFA
jgi:hypothetical protein